MVLYAPAEWWPTAQRRMVPFFNQPNPPSEFSSKPMGWMPHVVVGNGSPYDYFSGLTAPNRKFSHLWFAKDGSVEQYGPFSHEAWAAAAGNPMFYMAETEGFPGESYTEAQLMALAEFHVWIGADDHVAMSMYEGGISAHYLGGSAWGGHDCPGSIRAQQRYDIIQRAQIIRGGGDDMQLSELAGWDVSGLCGLPAGSLNFQTLIGRMYVSTVLHPINATDLANAIAKVLPPGSTSDAQTVANDVVAQLASRLQNG